MVSYREASGVSRRQAQSAQGSSALSLSASLVCEFGKGNFETRVQHAASLVSHAGSQSWGQLCLLVSEGP